LALEARPWNYFAVVYPIENNIPIFNYKSQLAEISYGVPQDSSLGPLLLLLYIIDLPQASQLDTTLFADDTYLTLSDKSITNLECKVNYELIKIEEWLK